MTVLRESPWYQEILKEGLTQGEQQGLQQGLQQGVQQGLQRGEATLVLRQLSRRFGVLNEAIAFQIRQLTIPELESLGESLLDFQDITDLHRWLEQNRESVQP